MAGIGQQHGAHHARDLRLGFEPFGNGQRRAGLRLEPEAHGAQATRGERCIIGRDHLSEFLRGAAERGIPALASARRAHHQIGMAADMLRKAHHHDIAAVRERGEPEGARPGVVDQADRTMFAGDGGEGGDVAHLEGKAARAFEPHGLHGLGEQGAVGVHILWVEEGRRHPQPRQQAGRHAARRVIGVVGHQQPVTGFERGEQASGNRRHPAGIEHRAMRAGFKPGQRIGQRPLGRRAAAPVEELAIGVGLARLAPLRIGVVEVGRGAPHWRVDHRAGPFLAPSAAHQPGGGLHRLAVAAAVHASGPSCSKPCALGVAGSALHSLQLPS